MKIIITGATGLIGAELVRQALTDTSIDELILLVRSQPEIQHPKITVVLHQDFFNYTGLEDYFVKAEAIIWSLGISQTQVSRRQYENITYGYLDACTRFCMQVHPSVRFVFVSGDGADRMEKSRTLFKRIKGKAENALLGSGLKDIYIARPDAVRPKHKNKNAPLAYKLVYPLFPLVAKLAPNKVIWSDILAKALLYIVKNGYKTTTVENIELRMLGKTQ